MVLMMLCRHVAIVSVILERAVYCLGGNVLLHMTVCVCIVCMVRRRCMFAKTSVSCMVFFCRYDG